MVPMFSIDTIHPKNAQFEGGALGELTPADLHTVPSDNGQPG